jgi:hypothetical protein
MMRAIVVVSLALDQPEQLAEVLDAIKPPSIPHFDGEIRVAIDPVATRVIDWLDES